MTTQKLPLFDVPKYNGNVAGGSLAVAMSFAKREALELRDLPNPPANLYSRKPN